MKKHSIVDKSNSRSRYLLFASELSEVVENIDDISYSTRCFFDLGGQVYTCHGNNLEKESQQVDSRSTVNNTGSTISHNHASPNITLITTRVTYNRYTH